MTVQCITPHPMLFPSPFPVKITKIVKALCIWKYAVYQVKKQNSSQLFSPLFITIHHYSQLIMKLPILRCTVEIGGLLLGIFSLTFILRVLLDCTSLLISVDLVWNFGNFPNSQLLSILWNLTAKYIYVRLSN